MTHQHTSHVYQGLTHGIGLVLVIVAAVAAAATGGLVAGPAAGWARYTSVASVALVVAAWGLAMRPYLVPTSLTVQEAAGADATLQWLMIVSLVALVLIGPALVMLYRLDTHGVLEPLTDKDIEE